MNLPPIFLGGAFGRGRKKQQDTMLQVANSAARVAETATDAFLPQDSEAEEAGEGSGVKDNPSLPPPPPKKRAILLTAFLVCISFLIFFTNVMSSLVTKIMQNDQVWNHLNMWMNATCRRDNKTLRMYFLLLLLLFSIGIPGHSTSLD